MVNSSGSHMHRFYQAITPLLTSTGKIFKALTLTPTLFEAESYWIEQDPPEAKARDIHFPEYR